MRLYQPRLHPSIGPNRAALSMLLGLPLLALPVRADIVLGPGDDLVAAVASAPDGETLVLASNGTYTGTLSWLNRSLTLRAGEGFTPTVRGSDNGPALAFGASSSAPTIGRFIGIRFEAGSVTSPTPAEISVLTAGTGSGAVLAQLHFEDCRLLDGLILGGTGDFRSQVNLQDCEVGAAQLAGTGDAIGELNASNSSFDGVTAFGTGRFRAALTLNACLVNQAATLSPSSDATVDFDARRTRFRSSLFATASVPNQTKALLVSCHFQSPSAASGLTAIEAQSPANVRGINLTITRYAIALDTEAPSRFSNLLIYQNTAPLGVNVLPADIDHSMFGGLPSGFAVNGNFQGIPLWDAGQALLPGSPGIDAGDSSLGLLGQLDLNGSPRITDGNQSGSAEVNVGAIEHYGNCPPASATLLNGSGSNPQACQITSLPQLGGLFRATITPTPNTVASLLAYDAEGLFPFVIPGIEGEVLLAASVNLLLDIQTGIHQSSVPNTPSLIGRTLAVQGFRILLNGPLLGTQALNGWSLVLGY